MTSDPAVIVVVISSPTHDDSSAIDPSRLRATKFVPSVPVWQTVTTPPVHFIQEKKSDAGNMLQL
jgi:hypothetical protein